MNKQSNEDKNFEKYTKELLRMYRQSQKNENQIKNMNVKSNVQDGEFAQEESDVGEMINSNLNAFRELNDKSYINNENKNQMQNNEMGTIGNAVKSRRIDKSVPPSEVDNTNIETIEETDKQTQIEYESLDDFRLKNPSNGFIKAQVFLARGALPVKDAEATIYKYIAGQRQVFHNTKTDESGKTSALPVPTPELDRSFVPGGPRPFQTYTLEVKKEGFRTEINENLSVFPGVISIQPVGMKPTSNIQGEEPEVIVEEQKEL